MTVYHGTSGHAAEGILRHGPVFRRRCYGRLQIPSFCVTTDWAQAELFALRHTPITEFEVGIVTGVILEFELWGDDWDNVVDPRVIQDEGEIHVYSPNALAFVAHWSFAGWWDRGGDWERYESDGKWVER